VTDNHPGGSLGREFGFAATVSLDDNPADVKRLFSKYGLTITSVCAHATLLDPSSTSRYATSELMRAIKLAALMDVEHVVTTEGEASTEWGESLTSEQQVFITAEKLHEPVRMAADLGVSILLEPHGPLPDSIEGMKALFELLGQPDNVGVNLDTGNSWLGGADPVEYAQTFKDKIWHVHWKDLPADWEDKRGTMYGCGFSPIALGEGIIDLKAIYNIVKDVEYCTLEIGGDDNVKKSYDYLKSLGAE
jgi:inosose dehydratase